MTNNITGDKYYPRPTHASLAIRALKNRQTRCTLIYHSFNFRLLAWTLSPISEPSDDANYDKNIATPDY